jgi:hypothetical protein
MENEKIETTTDSASKPAAQTAAEAQAKLMSIQITDENVALNVMVSFLNIAQRRGVFSIDESSKIWECIQKFQRR